MSLFSGTKSYLGVDLGSAAIKVVELSLEKGHPKLVTYGYIEETSDLLRTSKTEIKDKVAESLKMVLKKAKASTNQVVAALPTYAVFSSTISLPDMPQKELVEAIKWEAKKFVPMPLEEMILDWKVLGELEKGGKEDTEAPRDGEEGEDIPKEKSRWVMTKEGKMKRILLTAAPKDLVSKYIEIFKKSELELASLETEAFALERSLVGNDKAAIMIIDIGAQVTNIIIASESVPLINRSIDLGGFTLTKTIANSMNIDLARAEQFKRDFGVTPGQDGEEATRVSSKIEFMINSIVNEIKYVINLHQNQSSRPLEKIILTGGSALLPNLPEYLNKQFKMNVYIGDPWARVTYPTELKGVLKELGPSFAVAIGLALREII